MDEPKPTALVIVFEARCPTCGRYVSEDYGYYAPLDVSLDEGGELAIYCDETCERNKK